MAVRQQFGHLGRDAARGVRLRHDRLGVAGPGVGGGGFLADAFQRQIRAGGITPSCAFVGEPATNAVVERFFRTLRARIGHGRVCKTIEDVRKAVRDAFARYTVAWPLEKNGCLSPHALGHRPDLAAMPAPAQHTHVSKEPGAGQSRNARRRIALGHAVSVTPLHPLPGKRESVALRAEA